MSKSTKLFAGFVGIVLTLALVGGVGIQTASAAALTQAQVDAIVSLLRSFGADQTTINNVSASLTGGTPTTPTTPSAGYTFSRNLKQGDTGADVMNLQKVLNMDPATQVSVSGAGSPGNETSTFGPATRAAVIKFQNKYASEVLTPVGLTAGTGIVGAMTRAKLQALSGGAVVVTPPGTTPPTTPVGTGITVSDPGQPGVSLAPNSASRVPFTKIRLSAGNDGDVTVNSVTVERTGLGVDTNFSGIVLLDENGLQIGDAKTFNSNHQATVGVPFVVKAGTSKVITVAGNMADNTARAGQVVSLTVVSVNTNGAVVSGTLPITGAAHTINATLSLGSVTLGTSSYDPNSGVSKEVGTTGYKFTGFRLTAGSTEKVRLWSIRWYQSGSVSSGDLANVQTYVDGVAYPTTVSSDGKYFTSLFSGGILMDKGSSKDIWVSGDIVGTSAAGRTVQFDVFKTTDVYLTGETYGYGITPPAGTGSTHTGARTVTTFTTSNPWIEGSTVTVTSGSATSITKSTSVPAQNIAVGVANQVLGGFETDIKGEPISVQQIIFTIATSTVTGSYGALTNVSIVDQNGAVVAGPVDAVYSAANVDKVTFTDTITFPVGKRVYTIKGKVPTTILNNTAYTLSSTPSSQWTNITGMVTGNTITLSNGAFSMNQMTVKAGSLAVTVSPTPSAQTIVAGGTERLFANYQLDASQSGEDVRLSSMKAQLTFTVGTANELSGCRIYDGGNALNSTVVDPASTDSTGHEYTFTFDQALVVPKGTVKTLALKCNVSTSATSNATFAWGIANTAANITPTGVNSGSDITETVTAATGQAMTIGSGSLAVTTDSSSPSYTVVAGGTTGQIVGVYKFTASNENMNLQRIGLTLSNTASSTPSDLTNVTIWDGTTQVGSVQFTGSVNAVATSTLDIPVALTKDVAKTLTIKADVASIGANQPGYEGHLIAINFNSAQASGIESGATREATGSTAVNGIRIFKSYPVITYDTAGATAISGSQTLLSVKIAASGNDVLMKKLTFTIATTTATLTTPTFVGPNGNVASTTLVLSANASSPSTLSVYFDSTTNTADATIPSGSSKTYTLGGTLALTGSSNTVGSVSVALVADTAYPAIPGSITTAAATTTNALMASSTQASLSGANIIWSPMTTTTPLVSANDWTNGYGLPGCFLTSGLGQNCAARVISK